MHGWKKDCGGIGTACAILFAPNSAREHCLQTCLLHVLYVAKLYSWQVDAIVPGRWRCAVSMHAVAVDEQRIRLAELCALVLQNKESVIAVTLPCCELPALYLSLAACLNEMACPIFCVQRGFHQLTQ